MSKKRNFFTGSFRQKAQDYFVQVSLIILSLLIAVGLDRCNTASKQARTLQEYYAAIARDLADEEATNKMNLTDCRNDIADLSNAIRLFRIDQTDSLETGLRSLGVVITRGVFRTFHPTTFDVMSSTGDVLLIKDLELRDDLYSTFSFRTKIVEKDLSDYDEQVKNTVSALSPFIDYTCFAQRKTLVNCLINRAAFVQDPLNELVILQRQAQIRAFHLENAIRMNQAMIKTLDEILENKE